MKVHDLSIRIPHKERILFLCNVKTCGSAEKLPRSSGSFVKDFSYWCSAAGKSRLRKAVCPRFYNKYVSEIYIRCCPHIPDKIPICFLYTWYIKAIRYGYFGGNISQKRQKEAARYWIKPVKLYSLYIFKTRNCAPCTTVLTCGWNATG